jgi:hypothetical protein
VDAEAHVAHDDELTLLFAHGLVKEKKPRPLTSLLPKVATVLLFRDPVVR